MFNLLVVGVGGVGVVVGVGVGGVGAIKCVQCAYSLFRIEAVRIK